MLLTRGLRGLNAFTRDNANAVVRPGGGTSSGDAPGAFFSIQQHTWAQIDDLAHNQPSTSPAYKTDLMVTAAGLPPCTAESIDGSGSCYGGDAFAWDGPGTGGIRPLGTFMLWGVPISIDNVHGGRFNKVFRPSAYQRQLIEVGLIRESQKAILGRFGIRPQELRPIIGEVSGPWIGGNSGSIIAALKAKIPFGLTQPSADKFAAEVSVDGMMALVPDIALYWINFERNPTQPTQTERTSPGGWASWIRRGGYPLSRSLLSGQRTFGENFAVAVTAGPACTCPTNGSIVSAVGYIGKNGIQFATGKESAPSIVWDVYVSIYQDPANPSFEISMFWDDKAWITKLAERAADFMRALGNTLCAMAPAVQGQMTYSVSEKCADLTTKKPCTKGAANCVCVQPPSYVQAGAGATNAVMSLFCPAWAADAPQIGPQPEPQTPDPEPTTSTTPWWMIIGGGLIIGGALFARK